MTDLMMFRPMERAEQESYQRIARFHLLKTAQADTPTVPVKKCWVKNIQQRWKRCASGKGSAEDEADTELVFALTHRVCGKESIVRRYLMGSTQQEGTLLTYNNYIDKTHPDLKEEEQRYALTLQRHKPSFSLEELKYIYRNKSKMVKVKNVKRLQSSARLPSSKSSARGESSAATKEQKAIQRLQKKLTDVTLGTSAINVVAYNIEKGIGMKKVKVPQLHGAIPRFMITPFPVVANDKDIYKYVLDKLYPDATIDETTKENKAVAIMGMSQLVKIDKPSRGPVMSVADVKAFVSSLESSVEERLIRSVTCEQDASPLSSWPAGVVQGDGKRTQRGSGDVKTMQSKLTRMKKTLKKRHGKSDSNYKEQSTSNQMSSSSVADGEEPSHHTLSAGTHQHLKRDDTVQKSTEMPHWADANLDEVDKSERRRRKEANETSDQERRISSVSAPKRPATTHEHPSSKRKRNTQVKTAPKRKRPTADSQAPKHNTTLDKNIKDAIEAVNLEIEDECPIGMQEPSMTVAQSVGEALSKKRLQTNKEDELTRMTKAKTRPTLKADHFAKRKGGDRQHTVRSMNLRDHISGNESSRPTPEIKTPEVVSEILGKVDPDQAVPPHTVTGKQRKHAPMKQARRTNQARFVQKDIERTVQTYAQDILDLV